MKLLILSATVLMGLNAFGAEDLACMRSCVGAGSSYGFCAQRCEYNALGTMPQMGHMPDLACVRSCTAAGFAYGYCSQRCAE